MCRRFSSHLGKYQEVQLLGYVVRVCLVFLDMAKLYSKVAVPFCILTNNECECLLLHLLTALGVARVLDSSHSNNCEVRSHCCSNLQFPNVEHLLLCLFAICIFFGEVYVQIFCSFLNWVVNFLIVEFYKLFEYLG